MPLPVSAWIMDRDREKGPEIGIPQYRPVMGMAWGPCRGNAISKAVALKEIREESGLESVRSATEDIFSLDILRSDGHEKRGSYAPSHLHPERDLSAGSGPTSFPSADQGGREQLRLTEFGVEEIERRSTEKWFVERIYSKLCKKGPEGRKMEAFEFGPAKGERLEKFQLCEDHENF